jgi:tRNA (adenine57-N1/adenine58-N1)-methyltransferase
VGSGALSVLLGNAIRPEGEVHSYEIREEFVQLARRNIERAGLEKYVTVHHQDVTQGVSETDFTAVILDLGEPWQVIPNLMNSIRGGGVLASYSPTIEQVMKTVSTLESLPFVDIRTVECLVREILVREGKTRPNSQMVGHTGYLTFGRRFLEQE